MIFHDVTIAVPGNRVSRRVHESTSLVPGAVELFRHMLERYGDDFRRQIPLPELRRIELHWTSQHPSAALATFWVGGELCTSSALVSGRDADADQDVIRSLQRMLTEVFHDTPAEPGFDLLALGDRPLIASVPWPKADTVSPADIGLVADMETCLAAAFFARGGA